jgi:hypothetical protein
LGWEGRIVENRGHHSLKKGYSNGINKVHECNEGDEFDDLEYDMCNKFKDASGFLGLGDGNNFLALFALYALYALFVLFSLHRLLVSLYNKMFRCGRLVNNLANMLGTVAVIAETHIIVGVRFDAAVVAVNGNIPCGPEGLLDACRGLTALPHLHRPGNALRRLFGLITDDINDSILVKIFYAVHPELGESKTNGRNHVGKEGNAWESGKGTKGMILVLPRHTLSPAKPTFNFFHIRDTPLLEVVVHD